MLRIAFSLPFSIILLIAVSGCVGLGLEKARKSPPPDRAYMNVLYEGYLELSDAEYREGDYPDSDLFARKAMAAAGGTALPPEEPGAWRLTDEAREELGGVCARLVAAIGAPATQQATRLRAEAQVMFDCWIQEKAEDRQPGDIARCRDETLSGLAALEAMIADEEEQKAAAEERARAAVEAACLAEEARQREAERAARAEEARKRAVADARRAAVLKEQDRKRAEAEKEAQARQDAEARANTRAEKAVRADGSAGEMPSSAPVAPTGPQVVKYWLIGFDLDSIEITVAGQQVIEEAVSYITARAEPPFSVHITGHADRAGTRTYNAKLAERRAEAVALALMSGGVSARLVEFETEGEDAPAVETPDGVTHATNRRVLIEVLE